MDFVSDKLFDDQPFRILTIVDCHAREALATSARTNFRAYQVVEELDRIIRLRRKPRSIRVDNGPEFAGRLLDQWAYLNKIELDFSRPGKPSDNAYIEAFNSRIRHRSASMLHGSYRWPMPGNGSMNGGSTITNIGHIRRLAT
jgi:putative transposase